MVSYHLPGLFEFYELYHDFLDIYDKNREYFYEWCEIGSIYGSPNDCIWSGGRIECSDTSIESVIALVNRYNISARLTFSNSLLEESHLNDSRCNMICQKFNDNTNVQSGIIVHSDLLLDYLKNKYSNLYFVSSTTKVLDEIDLLKEELTKDDFAYVVADFRLNKEFDSLKAISDGYKRKVEFLCNECCYFDCQDRKNCYEVVSRKNLGEDIEHYCKSPDSNPGYSFSKAMTNKAFISIEDIREIYEPMGYTNFKIEGRSLGSALILEFLLYYMTKPQYHINVREKIYLSNMLDLY